MASGVAGGALGVIEGAPRTVNGVVVDEFITYTLKVGDSIGDGSLKDWIYKASLGEHGFNIVMNFEGKDLLLFSGQPRFNDHFYSSGNSDLSSFGDLYEFEGDHSKEDMRIIYNNSFRGKLNFITINSKTKEIAIKISNET